MVGQWGKVFLIDFGLYFSVGFLSCSPWTEMGRRRDLGSYGIYLLARTGVFLVLRTEYGPYRAVQVQQGRNTYSLLPYGRFSEIVPVP